MARLFSLLLLPLAVGAISSADLKLVAGGIVEGFVSDKPDLKTCIAGAENTIEDVEEAVKDFEKKDAIGTLEGLKALASAMKAFPAALTSCKATVEDVESIVNALKQIKSPTDFAFHIAKDLIVNGRNIYTEITTSVADYKTQKYEDFGMQVGMALHKLIVGVDAKFSKSNQVAIAAISGADLKLVAGGIVEGFLSDKPDLKTCIAGAENTIEDVEEAVKDFEKKDAAGALEGLKALALAMKAFPAALTACKATVADIESIVNALKEISSPKGFIFHIAKDLIVNGRNIYTEISTAVTDYKAQKYEDFGMQVGMALHKLIVGVDEQFSEFEQFFQKQWKSEEERQAAKLMFEKNLHDIKRLNEAEGGSAVYSHLTPFADLSPEEFSNRHGFRPNSDLEAAPVADLLGVSDLPANFDWREKGAVNAVKNQGSCGSCWAFATVANIEGAGFVTNGKLLSLSEQELVDCDKKTGDVGCQGGLPANAYKDMIQSKMGLVLESTYPYTGATEKCTLQASQQKAFITGYQTISKDEDQIAAAVVKYGPLAIGINAGPMQWYHGGIANPWTILCNPTKIDHGVAIVGFGVEGSKKFWIIRNSWGATWGEKGYYRIVRGVNKCGLTSMVTTATGITTKTSQIVV